MSEMKKSAAPAEIKKIDITDILDRFLHALARRWWIVVILSVALGTYNYQKVSNNYVPSYVAEATLTISATSAGQKMGADYTNISVTSQLSKIANILISDGLVNDAIADELGVETVPATVTASSLENTNYLIITATGADAEDTYKVLQAAIHQLPEVSQSIVGQIYTDVLMDSGIPSDSGKETISRGSARKGALVGILAGLLIVLLDMLLQRTVRYPNDISSMLHIDSLGKLPEVKGKKRRKGSKKEINIMDKMASSDYLESIRAVRARVERKMEKVNKEYRDKHPEEKDFKDRKTLLITSSIPSEGKSTVSANMALSFAKKGKKTILVDCDLRHPSIQKILGIEGSFPGLEKVLNGEATLEEALYRFPSDRMELYVICGAQEISENIGILGGETMKLLINQLENVCDVLILDTPPTAMLADAITMAKNVSMALYVVRCDYAKVNHILTGISELNETGINIIGSVLNYSKTGSKGRAASYGYGYGLDYGNSNYGRYGYGRSKRGKEEEDDDLFLNEVSFADEVINSDVRVEISESVYTTAQAEARLKEEEYEARRIDAQDNIPESITEGTPFAVQEDAPQEMIAAVMTTEVNDAEAQAETAVQEAIPADTAHEGKAAEAVAGEEAIKEAIYEDTAAEDTAGGEADAEEAAVEVIAAEEVTAAEEITEVIAPEAKQAPTFTGEENAAQAMMLVEKQDLEKRLKSIDHTIKLVEDFQNNRQIFRTYQRITDKTERIAYAKKHREEIEILSNANRELNELFQDRKLPKMADLQAEREILQVKLKKFEEV